MTTPHLRHLFAESTSDIPASVAQPPLAAIHRRVRRRRVTITGLATFVVVLVALAVALPLRANNGISPAALPSPTSPAISWDFGFAQGNQLTVYAARVPRCTTLENPVAVARTIDGFYVVTLTGDLVTASDCPVLPTIAIVKFPEAIPTALIKDAISGQIRPVYDSAELPDGFPGGPGVSWGFQRDGVGKGLRCLFQTQRTITTDLDLVDCHGRGISTAPLAVPGGEPLRLGPKDGWLAFNGTRYRFVWHERRADTWITYELETSHADLSKAKALQLLKRLTWS